MKIRIEFSESKSKAFTWAVRLCKKFKTYCPITEEDGTVVHTVELDFDKDWGAFEVIGQRVGAWKTSAFYLDGALMPYWQIMGKKPVPQEDPGEDDEFRIPSQGTIDVDDEHLDKN